MRAKRRPAIRAVAGIALLLSIPSLIAQGFADYDCDGPLTRHLIWFGTTLALAVTAFVLGMLDVAMSRRGRAAVIPAVALVHLIVTVVLGFFVFIGSGFACI